MANKVANVKEYCRTNRQNLLAETKATIENATRRPNPFSLIRFKKNKQKRWNFEFLPEDRKTTSKKWKEKCERMAGHLCYIQIDTKEEINSKMYTLSEKYYLYIENVKRCGVKFTATVIGDGWVKLSGDAVPTVCNSN